MNLTVFDIRSRGDLEKERVILRASGACNTANYVLMDSTYSGEGVLSNESRTWSGLPAKPPFVPSLVP